MNEATGLVIHFNISDTRRQGDGREGGGGGGGGGGGVGAAGL